MKKIVLALGLVLLMASCTVPPFEGMEHVNSIERTEEGYYSLEVYRMKLDGKHDYLIVQGQDGGRSYGLCHDPECAYCQANREIKSTSEDWTW